VIEMMKKKELSNDLFISLSVIKNNNKDGII